MSRDLPPIVAFAAPSGTGKTSVIERVIPVLVERGYKVAALKHDAHRLELDKPGKDTWRLRKAGAWRTLISGDAMLALFADVEATPDPRELVRTFLADANLVITEGYRMADLPVIRVHRAARADADWVLEADPIAWVSDEPLERQVPVLPLNEPVAVADFLQRTFLGATPIS